RTVTEGITVAEALTIRRTDRRALPDDRRLAPTESIEYLQADRRRREHRGSFGYRLRPNGRSMFPLAPRTALIVPCDWRQTFHRHRDDRPYPAGRLQSLLAGEEMLVRAAASGQLVIAPAREPTVLVETETVDTGERKESFGHTARHVVTTRRVTPLAGAK